MSFGVTDAGFVKKTFDDISGEIQADERANIDAALNLSSTSVFGQLNGIIGDQLRQLWDVAEAVYSVFNPNAAEGSAQDQICALNNVRRLPATFSTVVIRATGTPGTVLPVGQIVSDGTNQFISLADATIPGGGFIDIDFQAQETGTIAAPAGTLTTIVTPVAGWASATNQLDADLGSDIETDAAMRVRRIAALTDPGDTTDSILSEVKKVTGVTNALIFENTSEATDPSGVPGKSFETIVEGGDDQEIANAIFSKKPAGIEAYGTTLKTVNDSQGNAHSVGLSRPVDLNIYIVINVAINAAVYGGGSGVAGNLLVQEALVAKGDSLSIGADVVAELIKSGAWATPGVMDITAYSVGIAPAPVTAVNIPVTNHQQAKFDTSRVTVTTTIYVDT